MKTFRIIGLLIVSMLVVSGNAQALDWIYSYDPSSDASGGPLYEVYRMGYAYDDNNLYFNMLTGFPQTGDGSIEAGDLYINVGGSHNAGTGTVFGLALTDHEGDMNDDTSGLSWVTTAHEDNGYAWTAVQQGYLYKDAVFSTGLYEGYNGANDLSEDGGLDPFGDENNIPVHIAEFGEDLGFQGNVTWVDPDNDKQYEVDAIISLAGLGLQTGGEFEFWWSMECGNELGMIAGEISESSTTLPEPGTLLLLGGGLLGLLGILRKRAV